MIFNVNDRVVLVNMEKVHNNEHSKSLWRIDKHNPLWGSEYQSIGTVTEITEMNPYNIKVKWDNGITNGYREINLSPYPPKPINMLPEELFEL